MDTIEQEARRQGEYHLRRIRRLTGQQALQQLKLLDPSIFESLTAALFAEQGFRATTTGGSADGGVDVVLEKAGQRAIVQCKRYDGSVGEPTVRDLYGTMLHHDATAAYLVTSGDLTQQARAWAEGKPIHLVNGLTLVGWLGANSGSWPQRRFGLPMLSLPRRGLRLAKMTATVLLAALVAWGGLTYWRSATPSAPDWPTAPTWLSRWSRSDWSLSSWTPSEWSLPGWAQWPGLRPLLARADEDRTLLLPVVLNNAQPASQVTRTPTVTVNPITPTPAPVLGYTVVHTYPHDAAAFTQGLVFTDSILYEGTGLYGRSSLRRVDLVSGAVLQQVALENRYFGEGIVLFGPRIYQLTWRSRTGFVYDRATLARLDSFAYTTEGWGFTQDGQSLIMSDGSETLYFWDPATLQELRRIVVRDGTTVVRALNELEYIKGVVWANVWRTDRIAQIDPASGHVLAWVDLAGILPPDQRSGGEDVLNGIAYDAEGDRIFVTGKQWPLLFEIRTMAVDE